MIAALPFTAVNLIVGRYSLEATPEAAPTSELVAVRLSNGPSRWKAETATLRSGR